MMDGIIAADHADEAAGVPRPLGYLVPRQSASIRARLHPWAVLGVWAWQTVFALVGAYPAGALVRAAYGGDPRGDATLGDPGSHALLELVSRQTGGAAAAAGGAGMVLVVAAVAGLVPLAALMTAMAHATHGGHRIGGARALGGGARSFPPLALLLVAVSVAEAVAVAGAVVAAETTQAATHLWLGEVRSQLVGGAVGTIGMALVCAMGVVHDLARAAVVRFQLGGLRAWVVGFRVFRAAPLSLGWSWAWRALASLAPIAVVGLLADRIGWRGGVAFGLLAVMHQAVVLARVALRASWLAKALRTVELSPSASPVEMSSVTA